MSVGQLHVAGAGGAEDVAGQHEGQAEQAPEQRGPEADAPETGRGNADTDGGK